MSVAFFDLDKTLLDVNSGRLWAVAEWRAGRISGRDLAWAGYWLGRYALGWEDGLVEAMQAAAATIRDHHEHELDARVRAWFQAEVVQRLRPGGKVALARHRAAGDRLVLATSSSIYAGRAAAEAFGMDDVIATSFEVVEGRFTGKITTLAMGSGKAEAALAWARANGIDLASATFYTDSASDRALLEAVGKPRIVAPDRPLARLARERGWPVEDWGSP